MSEVIQHVDHIRRQMKEKQIQRIITLKPGRKLDALIAEYVMGFQVEEWTIASENQVDYWYRPSSLSGKLFEEREPERVPNYSTTIYSAMQIVHQFSIWTLQGNEREGEVAAMLAIDAEYTGNLWVRGKLSIPEAICKAALVGLVEANRVIDKLWENENE